MMVRLFSLRQWCCMLRVSWTDICLFPGPARRGGGPGADGSAKSSKRAKASKEPGAAREAGPGLRSRSAVADIVCHLSRWGGGFVVLKMMMVLRMTMMMKVRVPGMMVVVL